MLYETTTSYDIGPESLNSDSEADCESLLVAFIIEQNASWVYETYEAQSIVVRSAANSVRGASNKALIRRAHPSSDARDYTIERAAD